MNCCYVRGYSKGRKGRLPFFETLPNLKFPAQVAAAIVALLLSYVSSLATKSTAIVQTLTSSCNNNNCML